MGFRWTISLVWLYFLVFLYSVLFSAFLFIIGIWYIVYLLDLFLFMVFLYFSSHSPFARILFVRGGPRVLGHGAEFHFVLREDCAELDIGTLLVPWFRRWRYIACSC